MFVFVKQAMCEQICVGAGICVGRFWDWGEVAGLWGVYETSWDSGVGGCVCDFCMIEGRYGQAEV